ncbi:hypothetical protein VTL71DRAFT_6867 [Oculimacula yallundae]|uniref:FAD-binding domain-containing protein n=1 Tax=Oculimacula yallundae TaxID=86028 RepID=A0ABR4BV24_9HELO
MTVPNLSTTKGATTEEEDNTLPTEILPNECILIVGGGPVGLFLSKTLSHYGVRSVVLERNETTTRWPKMDLTNVRSMELFRRLGLAQRLRDQGVSSHIPYTVRVSTGLHKDESVVSWFHPGVDEYRTQIAAKNDGTMPLEPWQRLSQAVFEKWLKAICDESPLIDARFGQRVEKVEQVGGGAKVTVFDVKTRQKKVIYSRYIVGCDGASSMIRRSMGIPLVGGPVPAYVLLVHFKSRDLRRLHAQGRFWHLFFIGDNGFSGAAISQNEIDTWTTHLFLPLDQDPDTVSSQEAVETVLGGIHGRYEIKIDEVLVRSTYRPSIAIADNYSVPGGNIFLAGDAAHQNIPTGGYGMNMGLADAFELGWKLAAVVNGFADAPLLDSYETERRAVAVSSIERSGVHMKVHSDTSEILGGHAEALDQDTVEGRRLRAAIQEHYEKNDGENTDLGTEMGYCYQSPVIVTDGTQTPDLTPAKYTPTTYPGSRAPHVYLRDGTAIFDHYGLYYTLIEFSDGVNHGSMFLLKAAEEGWVPVKHAKLIEEEHAHGVWGRRMVLVRPDGHVAWRADELEDLATAKKIIATIRGAFSPSLNGKQSHQKPVTTFTATVENDSQDKEYVMERMGEYQI